MTDQQLFAPLQDLSGALVSLVAAAATAVVSVHSHRSRSSGFVWRPGLIVTADEALADEGDVAIALRDGTTVAAKIAGRDPTTDIALLRIERTELPPASLDGAALAAGAVAVVVGIEDDGPTAALGIVSRAGGSWQSLRGGQIDARLDLDIRLRQRSEGGIALDPRRLAVEVERHHGGCSAWRCSGRAGAYWSFRLRPSSASHPGLKVTGALREAISASAFSRWPSRAARKQARWS